MFSTVTYNKLTMKLSILFAVFVLTAPLARGAVTVLVDDDGASTSGWLKAGGILDTTAEAGFMTYTPNLNSHFLKYFDTTTLAVGETITLTATFKFSGIVASNNNQHRIRFGLFDSDTLEADGHPLTIGDGIDGYMGTFSVGGGTQTHLYQSNPGNNSFMVQAIGNYEGLNTTDADGGSFSNNTPYTLAFTVARTALGNDLTYGMTPNGINVTASDTGGTIAPLFSFDTVGFAVLDSPDAIVDVRFDSVVVETTGTVVPEPSAALLGTGGLAMLGLLRRRRK